VVDAIAALQLSYPVVSAAKRNELVAARVALETEQLSLG
jgi:hypothetical protein